MIGDERLARLRQVKLAALVDGLGRSEPGSGGYLSGSIAVGATLLDRASGRGWVLDEAGLLSSLGAALIWGRRHMVRELHLVVGSADPGNELAGVMARRALQWAAPPQVWAVEGRQLVAVTPAPFPTPIEPPAAARAWIAMLAGHGLEVVVEHGVITGEVLGLEVARVVPDQPESDWQAGGPDWRAGGGWHVEVGVGRHDREARIEIHPGESVGAALDRVAGAVIGRRVAGAPRHQANTLTRERWLRSVLVAHPDLAGARYLRPVAPPLPRRDLRLPAPAAAVGTALDGAPLLVVCSTGVDLDLVPTAADTRFLQEVGLPAESPAMRLVLVVPRGDDYPVTKELAAGLARPAEIVVMAPGWESLV